MGSGGWNVELSSGRGVEEATGAVERISSFAMDAFNRVKTVYEIKLV